MRIILPLLSAIALSSLWSALLMKTVQADVVQPSGGAVVVGVTVTRLEAGRLFWRTRDGVETAQPIEQVEYLQIIGWPLFNLAEKQYREHFPHQACLSYQKVLADLEAGRAKAGPESPGSANLDRALLLRCRLVRTHEADRQFDRAVSAYLELLGREDGASWQALRPRRIPAAGSAELALAARMIDAAIERLKKDDVIAGLRAWRATWPVASQPAEAAASIAVPDAAADRELTDAVGRVQRLLHSGRFDEAIAATRGMQKNTSGLARAEVFFWEAQCWSARATAVPAEAMADRRRAGLALMRIVIHFPESPRAPDSLYQAGRLCRDTGLIEQARTLWSELIARYPAGLPSVESGRQDLAALPTTPASQPARAAQ